jgi:pentatricopeptide repeat protein
VLDPSRDDLPQLQPVERVAEAFSHVDRIEASTNAPARPPAAIVGPEPEHLWCYYFEKADLARQFGDWRQVAQMADEARRRGLTPEDATEWLPVIEGYANLRRYDDAKEVFRRALEAMPAIQPTLSRLLKRLKSDGREDPTRDEFIAAMEAQGARQEPCLNCINGY